VVQGFFSNYFKLQNVLQRKRQLLYAACYCSNLQPIAPDVKHRPHLNYMTSRQTIDDARDYVVLLLINTYVAMLGSRRSQIFCLCGVGLHYNYLTTWSGYNMNLSLSLSALTIIKISAQRLSSYTKTVTKLFFGKGLTKRKKNKQTNKQKTVNQIIHGLQYLQSAKTLNGMHFICIHTQLISFNLYLLHTWFHTHSEHRFSAPSSKVVVNQCLEFGFHTVPVYY